LVGGGSNNTANTATSSIYKIVADQTISLNNVSVVRGIAVGKDGSFVIADTKIIRMLLYDANGNERKRIGGKGDGTNQFNEPVG
jgi:hypothetical protein